MTEDFSEINNYIFKEDIGQGNFGKVKLAIYKPTNEEFAIKIINKKMIKLKMKNVIFKENEIITKFNHINVIFVYNIIDTPDNYYIVMEYCKRGELFDYIVKHQKIKEDKASIFFYQIINGVEHIHSKGIAHRDLKPENILLTEQKIIKIIDFGLSHEFNGDDFLKTKCGSPSYASPEIISHPFYDGFKTDIWCCGIILYAMLCGYLPFDGEDGENNNNILFKNIVECKIEFPEYVSQLGKDLICKLLTVDPEKRITIPEIKNHPFYIKGKNLCKLDYSLIEEKIIKKRCYKNNFNINSNIGSKNLSNTQEKISNKNLIIEILDNNIINKEEENKKNNNNNYIDEKKINDNYLINNKINCNLSNNNDLSPQNKKMANIINFNKINKAQINLRNNEILNTDSNKYNPNIASLLKISKNFNLIDKIINTKLNYTKTLEQDKLYTNIYLSKINKDKNKLYNLKPSFRDILKNDKTLYFNVFGKVKHNRNLLMNKLDKPEYFLDKKIQNSNDNKTFNDEIFLRNFRKNLFKKEKLNKKKNFSNNKDCRLKNKTIDIDNKNNRIISLSNKNKKLKIKYELTEGNNGKIDDMKKLINNYEDKKNPKSKKNIINNTNNIKAKIKIIPQHKNGKYLSSDKYLYNKMKEINKDEDYIFDNSISIIKNNNNSFSNEKHKNENPINIENYIIPINKQHIYKSENSNKRKNKELSRPNDYKKIDDKNNLSKLIQNIINENNNKQYSFKKNNKSFFNRLKLNHKTIETYSISNRNNTIENKVPLNLTKKMKNFHFECKFNEVKNINEDLLNNKFLKNSRNLIRIKNHGSIKASKNDILPILTENNRNIRHNIKKI